ncbi:hypothetical protein C8R43DRAFT_1202887 [Mycena crocata]|nr:hypothetical protein C8R43DRAFT_1202887 [Mycena crocata]
MSADFLRAVTSSSLLDLPNELLIIILDDLDDDSLLHLASTCKRTNLLIIPMIFTRYNFELPASGSGDINAVRFTATSMKALPAIAIASFITSIDIIDFNPYRTDIPLQATADALNALGMLTTRLSHLGHLLLNPLVFLPPKGSPCLERSLYGRRILGSEEDQNDSVASPSWAYALSALLNSAAMRGDCILTVQSSVNEAPGHALPFVHSIPHVSPLPHQISGPSAQRSPVGTMLLKLTTVMGWFLPSFATSKEHLNTFKLTPSPPQKSILQSTERRSGIILPFLTRSALTAFNIHSSLLLQNVFYNWTLHTLNISPLTTLSLDHIDLLHYDWHLTLPAITLPALDSLHIGQCAIAIPDLMLFLGRHPSIRTLDLSFHSAIGALVPYATTHVLPHLACLRAPPDCLLYFLGAAQSAWPDLGHVSITSDRPSAHEIAQTALLVGLMRDRRPVPDLEVLGTLSTQYTLPTADRDA